MIYANKRYSFLNKAVSVLLIPLFMCSNIAGASNMNIDKTNLAPYSIFKIVEDNQDELSEVTQKRLEEFREGEADEMAAALAAKMVDRVKALNGLVTIENGRSLLVKRLLEWGASKKIEADRMNRVLIALHSAFDDIMKNNPEVVVGEIMDRLAADDFDGKIRGAYGLSPEEAKEIDPYIEKIGFDAGKNRLGWSQENLKWIDENPDELQSVIDDARAISENYKYVIFCGMGGSGLSVQTIKTTFGEKDIKIFSLRTTDPAVIGALLKELADSEDGSLEAALKETLVIPISKSGKTKETVSHLEYFAGIPDIGNKREGKTEDEIMGLFAKFGVNVNDPGKKHIWVITDKGSPLDRSDYEQRAIQLNGLGDIGGRYTSPSTRIFLLPFAITQGEERVHRVLKLAREMNEVKDPKKDVYMNLGAYLYWMANHLGKDKVTLVVPEALREIPLWAEQLFEESLGKDGKGVTLFYGERPDMSMLKSREENDRVFVRINLGDVQTAGILWQELMQEGYPTFNIDLKDLDEVGGLMMGLQRTVATIGYLWDINFTDQPAVDGYKNKTNEVMNALAPGEKVTVPGDWKYASYNKLKMYYAPLLKGSVTSILEREVTEMGADMNNAPAVYAAILKILDRTESGFEAGELTSYGMMTPELRNILENVRRDIYNGIFKVPAKVGEGPDKNHSYQQNIEGGKNMFFSTYFMPLKVLQPGDFVPGALPYDENIIKAQTIGTVNSMMDNDRNVVLITSDSTTRDAESDMKEFFEEVKGYLSLFSDINEVERQTKQLTAERGLENIAFNKTALVMKSDITDISSQSRVGTLRSTLEQQYSIMEQNLRKMFSHENGFNKVSNADEMKGKVNELIEMGFKVVVLDDSTMFSAPETPMEIKGKAGEDYAVVSTGEPNTDDLPFINLSAMALIGISIVEHNAVLFDSAYRLYSGSETPENLLEDIRQGILWAVNVLPRAVSLTGNIQRINTMKKLFDVAA